MLLQKLTATSENEKPWNCQNKTEFLAQGIVKETLPVYQYVTAQNTPNTYRYELRAWTEKLLILKLVIKLKILSWKTNVHQQGQVLWILNQHLIYLNAS